MDGEAIPALHRRSFRSHGIRTTAITSRERGSTETLDC